MVSDASNRFVHVLGTSIAKGGFGGEVGWVEPFDFAQDRLGDTHLFLMSSKIFVG